MVPQDAIDRIAPTQRPQGRAIGRQQWRELLFLHWSVPAEALRALVPPRLEIDLYDGRAYVGVVPFAMRDVRMALTPRALGIDTLETNVRTYVLLDGREPGVYFFSLDAESLLAVLGARAGFGLPYYWARMEMSCAQDEERDYRMQRRSPSAPRLHVRYRPGRRLGASAPGTLEFWLVERYLLFVRRPVVGLLSCQVHHPPYPVQEARVLDLHEELIAAAGLSSPAEPPLAHYAAGVDVEVFAPRRPSRRSAGRDRRETAPPGAASS